MHIRIFKILCALAVATWAIKATNQQEERLLTFVGECLEVKSTGDIIGTSYYKFSIRQRLSGNFSESKILFHASINDHSASLNMLLFSKSMRHGYRNRPANCSKKPLRITVVDTLAKDDQRFRFIDVENALDWQKKLETILKHRFTRTLTESAMTKFLGRSNHYDVRTQAEEREVEYKLDAIWKARLSFSDGLNETFVGPQKYEARDSSLIGFEIRPNQGD